MNKINNLDKIKERFWNHVEPDYSRTGCWLWKGGTSLSRGKWYYGIFSLNCRAVYAHRTAYELWREPIPEGLTIDHLCRNTLCVNPTHLEAVTQKENSLRGNTFNAVNAAKTHCPRGHEYSPGNTKRDKKGRRYCCICEKKRLALSYIAKKLGKR